MYIQSIIIYAYTYYGVHGLMYTCARIDAHIHIRTRHTIYYYYHYYNTACTRRHTRVRDR